MIARLAVVASTQAATHTWCTGLTSWLANVGQIAAALVAAGAIVAFAWGVYRRTRGRRRDRYGRLACLGTNAQISFFSSALGQPPAIRRTKESTISDYGKAGKRSRKPGFWTECIWIDRDFYVQAFADEDESIHAYSVTTRSKNVGRIRSRYDVQAFHFGMRVTGGRGIFLSLRVAVGKHQHHDESQTPTSGAGSSKWPCRPSSG
jgi:hypothetical protein